MAYQLVGVLVSSFISRHQSPPLVVGSVSCLISRGSLAVDCGGRQNNAEHEKLHFLLYSS